MKETGQIRVQTNEEMMAMVDFKRKVYDLRVLVGMLARALVDNPESVQLRIDIEAVFPTDEDPTASRQPRLIVVVEVPPSNVGMLIGKQGRIAQAMRTIVGGFAAKEKLLVTVNIVESK